MKRSEVEQRYKWDLSPIIADDAAWEALFTSVKARVKDVEAFKGRLADKNALLACLRESDGVAQTLERLYGYAHMKRDEDTKNDLYKGMTDRAHMLYTGYAAQCAFIVPEITALPSDTVTAFSADPDFADYDFTLSEILRKKAHTLSDGEERLLAMTHDFSGAFAETFSMLDNADINFKPVKNEKGERITLSHGVYSLLLQNPSRAVRAAAFRSMYAFFKGHINTMAANYSGYVKANVFYARARKYDNCIQSFMDGDAPEEVYTMLVDAVHRSLEPVHEYVRYRNEIIGDLHMYDMYVPLVPGAEIALPYEEAYKLVTEGLAPMGREYADLLREAYSGGWIDTAETENKKSGAYSTGVYGVHPYVLLNHQKTTHDVFTIAHEMGHALHTWYSNGNQPYPKAGYSIFVAEVASTVNEVLLLKHLLKVYGGNAPVKRYLLSYYLDMIRTTLFRQTMFAEFEFETHRAAERGESLTPDMLNKLYYSLNKRYYGDGVIHDADIAYEWARIPHFYYGFYVYKYATGITSAVCIAEDILKNGETAVNRYKEFLKSGGSAQPYEILKKAGVDLKTPTPYKAIMTSFAEALSELKKG